jgi:hypothetical protein
VSSSSTAEGVSISLVGVVAGAPIGAPHWSQ